MRYAIALGLALCWPLAAFSQQGAHEKHGGGAMPPAAAHGGAPTTGQEQHGAMADMHAHMKAMHEHSRMMHGISDPKRLDEEMKKHMRMMDEMMEAMMKTHGSASAPSDAPHKP